ncbi:hypothetical protein [Wolbachia endosymbiont of Brugia pahangi]|nr:hypothetical protein [Wolbachia endosymbiont of Brugia pahangi]
MKNLIDKYCGNDSKSKNVAIIIDPQVKSITEENLILDNVHNLYASS